MNTDKHNITDLLAQESFINYCKNNGGDDADFWESYKKAGPEHSALVEEAKEKFLQLFNALAAADLEEQAAKLMNNITPPPAVPVIQMEHGDKQRQGKKRFRMPKAAAAVILVASAACLILTLPRFFGKRNNCKTFTSANGERKNFQLPDGSFITLNAGSTINIKDDFGVSSRDVFLKGEAFFDVKHNENSPFIVHTAAMDIKALGTAFNVKAYQNENTTETSLIRGLVEVTLKEDNNHKMLLYPNQKIKWDNLAAHTAGKTASSVSKKLKENNTDSLRKSLIVSDDGVIKEIAWKSNKLVFDDEQFDEIALSLERWYGARLIFKDSSIRNYRFTGMFEKEDLTTVLDFLQESKQFNYEVMKEDPVTINLSR